MRRIMLAGKRKEGKRLSILYFFTFSIKISSFFYLIWCLAKFPPPFLHTCEDAEAFSTCGFMLVFPSLNLAYNLLILDICVK
jgi:hypothetical protein